MNITFARWSAGCRIYTSPPASSASTYPSSKICTACRPLSSVSTHSPPGTGPLSRTWTRTGCCCRHGLLCFCCRSLSSPISCQGVAGPCRNSSTPKDCPKPTLRYFWRVGWDFGCFCCTLQSKFLPKVYQRLFSSCHSEEFYRVPQFFSWLCRK